jgi:hypothetical protein
MPIEITFFVLVSVFGAVVTGMAIVGALCLTGAVRLTPCWHCQRLTVNQQDGPLKECVYCRAGHHLHDLRHHRPA